MKDTERKRNATTEGFGTLNSLGEIVLFDETTELGFHSNYSVYILCYSDELLYLMHSVTDVYGQIATQICYSPFTAVAALINAFRRWSTAVYVLDFSSLVYFGFGRFFNSFGSMQH